MYPPAFRRKTPAGSLYVLSGAILLCTPKGKRVQLCVRRVKETRNKPTAEEEQRAVPFLILARQGGENRAQGMEVFLVAGTGQRQLPA